jgi:VanZ family protein
VTKPWPLFTGLVLSLFVGTLMPGGLKAQIESTLWGEIPWSSLSHFALFAAMATLPVYGIGRAGVWRAILVAMFFAGATELLQSLVPGRHPLMHDALVDMGGALTGLALRSLWLARLRAPQMV